jgi:hypothetical protein
MMPRTQRSIVIMCGVALLCAGAGRLSAQGPSATHLVAMSREGWVSPALAARAVESGFARQQLEHARVRQARMKARPRIDRLFFEKGIVNPTAELYVRVFKRERQLEVWVRPQGAVRFEHLTTYGICGMAGKPGPKRRRGDEQVPEGFYAIDLFNPQSQFHLSLRLNYPNARDVRADPSADLGGDIYIHGGCRSEGCLAISDGGIEDLYWLAIEARSAGQSEIPVHIFPARIDASELRRLVPVFADQPELIEFWETLRPGYEYFETHRRVPSISIDERGTYHLPRAGI